MRQPPDPQARSPASNGIILVMIVALEVMLILLALAILQMTTLVGRGARATLAASQARLAAASGTEYAAARLSQKPLPDRMYPRSRQDLCDTWCAPAPFGTPIERMTLPAYARTEPWIESVSLASDLADNDGDGMVDESDTDLADNDWDGTTNEPDELEGYGIHSPGEALAPGGDIDRDGAFSAWTGRLRGARGARDIRFSLKVTCPEGLMPVNAGFLDARSNDLNVPYHMGLVHALNMLGVAADLTTRREDLVSGGAGNDKANYIRMSLLGFDLIQNRPIGGYSNWEQIEEVLGGYGYTQKELDALREFIDLGPYDCPAEVSRNEGDLGADFPSYAPVNLGFAPRELLRALMTYLACNPTHYVPCEPWARGLTTLSLRTGDASSAKSFFVLSTATQAQLVSLLFDDEADALAGEIVALRQSGSSTWQRFDWSQLYRRFSSQAATVFAKDLADLDSYAPVPLAARSWSQAKADLAFNALAFDPCFQSYPLQGPLSSNACGWGIDRNSPVPPGPDNGEQPVGMVGYRNIQRVIYPTAYPSTFPANPDPWDDYQEDPFSPYMALLFYPASMVPPPNVFDPQGGRISAPCQFQVESSSRVLIGTGAANARVQGRLRVSERLEFTCQEDFENRDGSAHLVARDFSIDDPGSLSRRLPPSNVVVNQFTLAPETRTYRQVTTLPKWNQTFKNAAGYSRTFGSVAPAPLEAGTQGCQRYWPFSETAAGAIPAYLFPSEPAGPFFACDLLFYNELSLCPGYVWGQGAAVQPFDVPWNALLGNIQTFTIECWMGPWSALTIRAPAPRPDFITLETLREPGDMDNGYGTTFKVTGKWAASAMSIPLDFPATISHFLSDDKFPYSGAAVQRDGGNYHVVLAFQRLGGGGYDLRLIVNGVDAGLPSPTFPPPFNMYDHLGQERLELSKVDEVRFYRDLLVETSVTPTLSARARFDLGRFPRIASTFTSPTYWDAKGRLLELKEAVWTGITPGGYPDDCIDVQVNAFDAGGNPLWSHPLEKSGIINDLSAQAPAAAFNYVVTFDLRGVTTETVTDVPIFEGIWFRLRRKGTQAAWSDWTLR